MSAVRLLTVSCLGLIALCGPLLADQAIEKSYLLLLVGITSGVLLAFVAQSFLALRKRTRGSAQARTEALEQELIQTQKMELINTLATGIVHDINNKLAAIRLNCAMARDSLATNSPSTTSTNTSANVMIDQIEKATTSAAHLTQQLLKFSRKRPSLPQTMPINPLIEETAAMMRRMLSSSGVELRLQLSPLIGSVQLDATQFDQLLMNLLINARDAMPKGGVIQIKTDHYAQAENGILPNGDYVILRITDSGTGMTPEVLEHIFEPFFTTKKTDQGTGLGLATVDRIVKHHEGKVFVHSEVGRGTTFEIFWPVAKKKFLNQSASQRTKRYEAVRKAA